MNPCRMSQYVFFLGLLISMALLPSRKAHAEPTWIDCTPVQVVTYAGRIHVKCAAAVGGITFFAAPTTDASHAARILSIISTAQVAGRTMVILYDPDDISGEAYGCLIHDCRPIGAVGFGQ